MPVCHLSGTFLLVAVFAAPADSWRDPSPHAVRFVTVDDQVRLEVLDWGGSGTPVMLLAGGGNTAHVFDDFAPKLAAGCHVYGITRRGFGGSRFSASETGLDRLARDVLGVANALNLTKPVLVGHSIAGAELSAVAAAHPERVAGVVYLEAGYPYAFDDGKGPGMKRLRDLHAPPPPDPAASDLVSFRALQKWDAEMFGVRMPEAEFRQTWDSDSTGRPTRPRDPPGGQMLTKILAGPEKHARIPVPALVIFAFPHVPEPWMERSTDAALRDAAKSYFASVNAFTQEQAKALEQGVPTARVVRLRGAHHIFLSNESDVLREMRAFIAGLR